MNEYQLSLKTKSENLAHFVYRVTQCFPKGELFGIISQMRRAALSVVLNYVEGYARKKRLVRLNFLEIAFGSCKELKCLLDFSLLEKYLEKKNYEQAAQSTEELGAMLWREIDNIERAIRF